MNLFGGGASSPSSSLSAPNVSADSVSTSPVSSFGSPRPSLSKSTSEIPPPHPDEEMPEEYLERLTDAVNKAEIAAVLASHADAFHARALKAYIDHFEFWGDPLDVSLRKLLMNVGLPRETQQIDRVIEAFAARYRECNPTLFASDDHPYILAFSLIMLHTDAFNKSNKRKMTKADYVKNTRLPGVAPEVLDCFYDNIVFAPFIYIEDPLDVTGQRSLGTDSMAARRMSSFNPTSPGGHNGSTTTLLGKSNKIDPYYLITHNLLDDLRVNVRALVPPESPYVYQGTGGSWDEDELLRAFVTARSVEIALVESRYLSSPWFGLGVSSAPGPMFSNSIGMSMAVPTPAQAEPSMVKVTKVGLLMRKDDTLEGGRRGMNRRWREWSVLLTGSQLLFFRDPSWATSVQARINRSRGPGMIPHPAAIPQPDELLSVKDAIAVYDRSYTKHSNTLRLALADGRQFLLQAQGETEMNDWIARINYASAFKSAGVRMRSLGMSSKDIELTGIAAAASHLRDVHHRATLAASPRVKTWNGPSSEDINLDLDFPPVVETAPSSPVSSHLSKTYSQRRRESSVTTSATSASGPTTPPSETASRLFKATFDEVKTELAAGRWHSLDGASLRSFQRPRAYSLESSLNSPPLSPTFTSDDSETSRFSSRSQLIRAKLDDLESKISLVRTQLDSHMRFVRNLAVLTPFQRATRDRMQLAVQGVAKHIMQVRLELEKLSCYRDILVDDLAAEERDWQRTKKIAMRAATEKLAKVPRMTLSLYVDEPDAPVLAPSPRSIPGSSQASTSSSRAADPSVDGSFHSALSRSSTEWPDRHSTSAMMADPAHMFDSPMSSPLDGVHGSASSGGAYPFPDVSERPQASPLATQSSMESTSSKAEEDRAGHEKFYTAPEMPEEQAEEWNKTKAAKRVSLVRLPSDLRISVLFGKHHRRISEDTASAPSSPRSSMGVNPYDRTEATVDTVAMLDV
ncbi:hypothetical protein CERSUDRAFT_110352 [Gelatoporia subvermispora B]|uniref:SEC7 domain-containing protein n=1 Tax=Ceriporiopsis subvermispora (strain B) TaxID=914234 RepID=M2PY08_CERS8|nr:hypothetical protein CERSUDRAFT_110352 [Gelatoporia subvermispora B]